jgi:two-component system, response regulator
MMSEPMEILLVEDNPNDVELTLRALRKHNLANRVHVANDGEEALDFIFARNRYADRQGQDSPKVILLDLKLPKVDGMEVLKALKSNEKTRMIPVVVVTSSREEQDLVKSYHLGANSYVVKPVDFEKFAQAVSEIGLYWLLLNQTPMI